MRYPTHDEYSNTPGYLCWFRDTPTPVRLANINRGVSTEDLQEAEIVSEFYFQVFDLSNEKDSRKYCAVSQRILDGWYTLLHTQRQWDDEHNTMRVWLEWTQDYLEVPDDK